MEIAGWSQSRRLCPSLGSCAARSGHVLWAIEMESDLEGDGEREKGRDKERYREGGRQPHTPIYNSFMSRSRKRCQGEVGRGRSL